MIFAKKRPAARPAARLFLPGAALLECPGCARGVRGVCPVLTVAAGRAQETAETYTNRVSTGLADTFAGPSIVRAKDGYWYPHGTGESPRGCEGSTRANPMVPALQI